MLNKVFFHALLLMIVMINSIITPQSQDNQCDMPLNIEEGEERADIGGRYKPSSNAPGEYFRALIVFAQLASDNKVISNWPKDSLPYWANDLIDQEPASQYRQWTISDYFKKMSNSNFDFIGDIYPNIVTVPFDSSYAISNKHVLSVVDSHITDFTIYDNWYFQDNTFYFSENRGDGYLDMVIIIYRYGDKIILDLDGGIANLGFSGDYITSDGITINSSPVFMSIYGSGITSNKGGYATSNFAEVQHFAHEFGHYLFGGGHTPVSGLMCGKPYGYYGITHAMNAWERERLGYISIPTAYSGQVKSLSDYATTNSALRINISSNEYLILENHQRISHYDQIIRGGAQNGNWDPYSQIGKGLYVWYFTGGTNYPPMNYAITADGGWNWIYAGLDTMEGWGGYGTDPVVAILERDTSIRYLPSQYFGKRGKSDRNSALYVSSLNQHWDRWHDKDPLTKNWVISRDVMGDETDAFTLSGVNQITPWSNPSTTKLINGVETPTNISAKILTDTAGVITVKVYLTQSGALSLPPSKPENLKVSVINNQSHLTWEANREPDMKYSGKYRIYRTPTTGGAPSQFSYVTTTNAYNGTTPVTTWTDYEYTVGSGSYKVFYRVTAVDTSNLESSPSNYDWVYWDQNMQKQGHSGAEQISEYKIFDNYPNPFNPVTTINYQIPKSGRVVLKVYDILGKEIATLVNEEKEIGRYSVNFDASKLSSGVYLYELVANDYRTVKKLMVIK